MGITGLTTLIKKHYPPETWRTYTFRRGSRVILDGKNICYPKKQRYNWVHGGQYGELRAYFNRFFECLKKNGIEPIVVFDGVDYTEEKSDTKLRRQKERITNIHNGLLKYKLSEGVRPLFTDIVLCEIAKENKVKVIYVDGDADQDIALLANHYNCPVVAGYDSDYFIFPLQAGYIPIDKLQWYNSPVTAKIYKRERFAYKFYFDSDPEMIYLIPVLMGNDFMDPVMSSNLKRDIVEALQEARDEGTEIQYDKMLELLFYITLFDTVEAFMTYVTRCCPQEVRIIEENYRKAKDLYKVGSMSEARLIQHTNLKSANGTALTELPDFIMQQYRNGCFATSVMVVLVQNKSTIPVVIDNPNCSSSMRIGASIRRCLYRIMAPYLAEATVLETIRCGQEFQNESVACADESLNLPSIDNMKSLSDDDRIHVLCAAMETPPEVLAGFTRSNSKWKLVALSLLFWSRHARPTISNIKALVLCFIRCSSWFNNAECPHVPLYKRNDPWLQLLHIFAQWKCVYYDASRLNNILMNPLEFMSPALLFNGKLVMHFACTRFDQLKGKILDSAETRQLFDLLVSVCSTS